MNRLVPAITKEEIAAHVRRVANEITTDYYGEHVVLVCVLKGAFLFFSDLVRQVNLNAIEIDFLQASSYGSGLVSSENIILKKDIDIDIEDKNVILVEDIVDTGLTLSFLLKHLESRGPKSIKICALIDKKEFRQVNIDVDYVCSIVNRGFLVGYGLDYAEKYRSLSAIYCMESSDSKFK